MKKLLQILEEKKQLLDSFRPLPPALLKNLDDWFRVELSYNSNAIEGNTLTKQETAIVIEKGLTISGKSLKEHLEITNYTIALDFIKNLTTKTKNDIVLADILDIHRLILKSIDDANAGKIRKIAIAIAGTDIDLPGPLQVPDLMDDFITWLHTTKDHPLKIAADAHFKLVAIHPFVDGNGRTARLLMNLLLMQDGYPPAIIDVKKRSAYIDAIAKGEKIGNLDDFYSFIFKSVEQSLRKYIDAAKQTIP